MLVSNTSTLVLLAKIGLVETFLELSGEIAIPAQVEAEYSFHKDSYYGRLLAKAVSEKRIIVKQVDERKLTNILQNFMLDKGEAAVYLMYKTGGYKAVMTDDGELIKLCKLEGIPFLCSLAIVIRLHEKGAINKTTAIEKLEKLGSIGRYSKEILDHYKKVVK